MSTQCLLDYGEGNPNIFLLSLLVDIYSSLKNWTRGTFVRTNVHRAFLAGQYAFTLYHFDFVLEWRYILVERENTVSKTYANKKDGRCSGHLVKEAIQQLHCGEQYFTRAKHLKGTYNQTGKLAEQQPGQTVPSSRSLQMNKASWESSSEPFHLQPEQAHAI